MPSLSLVEIEVRLWSRLRLKLGLRLRLGLRLGFISFRHSLDDVQILIGGWVAGEMGIKANRSQS